MPQYNTATNRSGCEKIFRRLDWNLTEKDGRHKKLSFKKGRDIYEDHQRDTSIKEAAYHFSFYSGYFFIYF